MKKLLSIFLIAILGIFVVSCTSDDNGNFVDNDTLAEVYDLKNINFDLDGNQYYVKRNFTQPLFDSDVVLVYKQSTTVNGNPVWELLPRTYYVNEGELDYTFDFTKNDIQIYAQATFQLGNTNYIRNQTFRVVVIPANFGKSANYVNFENYNDVIAHYKINDNNVINL